jgi:hypothetical protein
MEQEKSPRTEKIRRHRRKLMPGMRNKPRRGSVCFASFSYSRATSSIVSLDVRSAATPVLEERKGTLQYLLGKVANPGIQLNEHILGDGKTIFEHSCKLGFEGIVSQQRGHPYRSGPSKAWIKVKNPNAPAVLRFEESPSGGGRLVGLG